MSRNLYPLQLDIWAFPFYAFQYLEDIQCTPCPKGQWSQTLSTNCTEPTFDVLSWDKPAALHLALGGALLLLCQVGVAVVLLRHWRTPMVAASGGPLAFVVLFSLMGACLGLALFLGQPGDALCHLQLPLISIFQTIALSVIAAISLQVMGKMTLSYIA